MRNLPKNFFHNKLLKNDDSASTRNGSSNLKKYYISRRQVLQRLTKGITSVITKVLCLLLVKKAKYILWLLGLALKVPDDFN